MWTRAFWMATAERAAKTGAQFGLAAFGQTILGFDLFDADMPRVAGAVAGGVVLSVLTSLASATVGVRGSPSLAARAEIEAARTVT